MNDRELRPNGGFSPKESRKFITHSHGAIIHADSFGTDIAVRAKKAGTVEEYDAYLSKASRNVRYTQSFKVVHPSGAKLRRIVIMRRQGATWKECGEAVGVAGGTAKCWVELLPFELAV